MTTRFPHLHAAIVQHPWAIMPDKLEAIAEVVERRAEGVRLSKEEIAGIKGDRRPNGVIELCSFDDTTGLIVARGASQAAGQQTTSAPGSVIAVISMFGIIAQHASQVDDISGPGGTSTERVTSSLRSALADPAVKAIVLNIDSPGGNVHGVQALASEILNSRGQKPIVAQVNSLAASAAYWIASACDEIVVTPGGQVGSIGVYGLHQDVSKAADMAGVKFTFISAGKYKVEGNQFEPLSGDAFQALQSQIDEYYGDFTGAVAKGRGVDQADVVNGFGEGRVVKDKKAVKMGMADRVATMDETLRRLAANKKPTGAKALAAPNMAMPADAKSIWIEVTHADDHRTHTIVGEVPETAMFTVALLEDASASSDGVISLDVEASQVTFAASNGSATYNIIGHDPVYDAFIGALAASTVEYRPTLQQLQADEDSAAFRRRRHAHRMRSA